MAASVLLAGALAWAVSVAPAVPLAPLASRSRVCMAAKGAAATKAKGFGAVKTKVRKPAATVPLPADVQTDIDALAEGDASLDNYLNPELVNDPERMADVSRRLKAGEVVILRDAFRPAFAEMVHAELKSKDVAWSHNEAYFEDGYHHRHSNVYDRGLWSARLNTTLEVFAAAASKRLVAKLTGRDCTGETTGAPSWYQSGDHSLPHTDWVGQRTVSYVWHLSKGWKPEWGGALYWAQNDHAVATYPASFNTLALFSVTTRSAHFVTTVSPQHKGKRLTFNGWWNSEWVPRLDDECEIEERLASAEERSAVTHSQLQAIADLLDDPWQNIPAARRPALESLRGDLMESFFPEGSRAGISAANNKGS